MYVCQLTSSNSSNRLFKTSSIGDVWTTVLTPPITKKKVLNLNPLRDVWDAIEKPIFSKILKTKKQLNQQADWKYCVGIIYQSIKYSWNTNVYSVSLHMIYADINILYSTKYISICRKLYENLASRTNR